MSLLQYCTSFHCLASSVPSDALHCCCAPHVLARALSHSSFCGLSVVRECVFCFFSTPDGCGGCPQGTYTITASAPNPGLFIVIGQPTSNPRVIACSNICCAVANGNGACCNCKLCTLVLYSLSLIPSPISTCSLTPRMLGVVVHQPGLAVGIPALYALVPATPAATPTREQFGHLATPSHQA